MLKPISPDYNNHTQQLIYATHDGDLKSVKELVSQANNNLKSLNFALIEASTHGHLDITNHLIQNGADVHTEDNTPLKNAFYYGYLDIVKSLVNVGANLNNLEVPPLELATKHGHLQLVQYLIIEHFLNPEIALKEAINFNKQDIINWTEKYINIKNLNNQLENNLEKKITNIKINKI